MCSCLLNLRCSGIEPKFRVQPHNHKQQVLWSRSSSHRLGAVVSGYSIYLCACHKEDVSYNVHWRGDNIGNYEGGIWISFGQIQNGDQCRGPADSVASHHYFQSQHHFRPVKFLHMHDSHQLGALCLKTTSTARAPMLVMFPCGCKLAGLGSPLLSMS